MQRSIILGGIVAVGCAVAVACGSDDDTQIVPPAGDASMEAAADSATGDGGGAGGTAGRGGSGGIPGPGGTGGTGGVAGAGGTPPAMCTPVELVCDGAEDCPMGQICCGRVELAGAAPAYAEFACQDTCEFTMMGGWIELCHAGDTCANMEMCMQTAVLPTSLSRCLTMNGIGEPLATASTAANEVNCGDTVCAANEKCCLRQPDAPYCAPSTEACACTPGGSEAGAPEAGAAEAGATDGGPTRGGGNRDGGNQGGGQRDR